MKSYRPPRGHRWDDLRSEPEPPNPEEIEADRTFAETFGTPQGEKALELLHQMTTWRRNRPNDTDGALREIESQRRFVAILEARIARHHERLASAMKGEDGGRNKSGRK